MNFKKIIKILKSQSQFTVQESGRKKSSQCYKKKNVTKIKAQKHYPSIPIIPYRRLTSDVKTHTNWKNIFHATRNQDKAQIAILLSDNYFLIQWLYVIRNKEGQYAVTKWSIQHKDIIFVNSYAPNRRAPKYTKRILKGLKGEIK